MTLAQMGDHPAVPRCRIRLLLVATMALSIAWVSGQVKAHPPTPPDASVSPTGADPHPDARVSITEDHPLPQVTVEAQRRELEHRVNEFVRKMTNIPFSLQDSLPLWRDPLCFAVAGLPTQGGLYALGRLAEIARATGLHVGRPGCRYNFIVIFSPDPNPLLERAFHLHPHAFNTDGGMTPLQQFIRPAQPLAVRAWHNTRVVTRGGVPIGLDGACGSISVQGMQIPVSCQYSSSRIERFDVSAFSLALVVIDTSYPKALTLGALVDYAAMVGLTEIPAHLDVGEAPSIVRLFDPSSDAEPTGLTAWDSAFLRAVYHSDQANTTQRSEIAVQMLREVSR